MSELSGIIIELEKQRASLDRAISALRESEPEDAPKRRGRPPGKKTVAKGAAKKSPEGRKRQAEAMRASWAARRVGKKATTKKATKKATKKGGITPPGRKALSESLKRRWAEKKIGKKARS